MASCWCLAAASSTASHPTLGVAAAATTSGRPSGGGSRCLAFPLGRGRSEMRRSSRCGVRRRSGVVCMAPDEEKMTRRSPLDFPIEWERPKPGRRPDIFPKFSPMKTPLPPPLPADPPEEDEEEEEKKEEEEDPEKEEEENPDQQS